MKRKSTRHPIAAAAGQRNRSSRAMSEKASTDFEVEGPAALEALRTSLSAAVASVPGAAARPIDLAEAFGLDRKLAWKLSNVITGGGPDGAARYVPGSAGIRLFVEAARKRGVPATALDRVGRASDAFRTLIRRHAGDRESLDVLLTGLGRPSTGNAAPEIELGTRRTAFRAASAIWGVRAKVQFRTEIFSRNAANPDRLDAITLRGMVGLQRMRTQEEWLLFRGGWTFGSRAGAAQRRPLDVAAMRRTGVPLLDAYCSPTNPPVVRVPAPGAVTTGQMDDVLQSGAVGPAGEVTIVTGDRVDGVASRRIEGDHKTGVVATRARTPAELLVVDLLVERGAIDLNSASVEVLNDMDGVGASPNDLPRLPCPTEVTHGGRLSMREVANYEAMIADVFGQSGKDVADFDRLRVRVAYPIVPSALVVTMRLA